METRLKKLEQTSDRPSVLTTAEIAAITRIEAAALRGARKYFEKEDFIEVTVPHVTRITGSCENIDTLFGLDYFGEEAYLVQTGQLYLEALIAQIGKVFCIGPSFRAEPDVDERHLTEFTLVEIEFPGNFEQLLQHIESIVCAMVDSVADCRSDLSLLDINQEKLRLSRPFARMTYSDAIKKLKEKGFSIEWGDDLKSSHEKTLAGNAPLFITHYPEKIKFFNMRRNGNLVNSCDLILPFSGEAVGAAEREYDHDTLIEKLENSEMYKKLKERGKSTRDFKWYLDIVKKHPIQHSGCGIGLNRVMQFILETQDIRASTAFPMNRESLM